MNISEILKSKSHSLSGGIREVEIYGARTYMDTYQWNLHISNLTDLLEFLYNKSLFDQEQTRQLKTMLNSKDMEDFHLAQDLILIKQIELENGSSISK